MDGEPLATTFKSKLPPVQMDPPTGCALIAISGETLTATTALKMSSQPASVAATKTRYHVVVVNGSVVKPAVVPPASLTFAHTPAAILSCH